MRNVGRRRNPHFKTRRRNDFQPPRGAVVGGYRSTSRILLPRHVVAVLLDQHDVSGDDWRNKVWLAGASFVHGSRPTVHPIVLIRACRGAARPALSFAAT